MFSLVIPVYKNEANLPALGEELVRLNQRLRHELEVVFVVDGSPDACYEILQAGQDWFPFPSQLLRLSRNFGAYSAIAAGIQRASGDYFAVMAADLQEPPELIVDFFRTLEAGTADVVFGTREGRSDPFVSRILSRTFWAIYRTLVTKDMPHGGIDVFGCNRVVRDHLVQFRESNTNLIALLLWLGYRRAFIPYTREARAAGKSAWSIGKKVRYCLDSIFNFTDLPVRLLLYVGIAGIALAFLWIGAVMISKVLGNISVPGYSTVIIAILFFGGVMSLGLGILGQYLWLTLSNARNRPNYIIANVERGSGVRARETQEARNATP